MEKTRWNRPLHSLFDESSHREDEGTVMDRGGP